MAMGSVMVTMATQDAAFSAVRFCSYTVYVVRCTIGLVNDSCASCYYSGVRREIASV